MEHILKTIIIRSTVINIFVHQVFSGFPQDTIPEILLSLKEMDIFKVLDTQ